jgi:hypothetical protein
LLGKPKSEDEQEEGEEDFSNDLLKLCEKKVKESKAKQDKEQIKNDLLFEKEEDIDEDSKNFYNFVYGNS